MIIGIIKYLNKSSVGLVLFVYLILMSQIRFTAWPEMLLWPYLILEDWLPYKDIAMAHNPLLPTILSYFYQVFGVGITQLKIFTWIIVLGSSISTYWVARRLFNPKVAFYSIIFIIPLQIYFQVNGLWFDLFLSVFTPLIYYFVQKKSFFWVGLLWSVAYLS